MDGVEAAATYSPCGTYRYTLEREMEPTLTSKIGAYRVVFVMLNPSTATETVDDPTVRRCQLFARRWGYDLVTVANLYALRSTDPKALKTHPEPVGPDNDRVLLRLVEHPRNLIVGAWGVNAEETRVKQFVDFAQSAERAVWALGKTKNGAPRHPLYVKSDAQLVQWLPGFR